MSDHIAPVRPKLVTSPLVVAIDGPSGSGKSSTARGVAKELGLAFLDTGAMYRAATWLVLHSDVAAENTAAVADLVEQADISVTLDPDTPTVSINGTDVTEAIREPVVSAAVSVIATNLAVRENMVARQQAIIAGAEQGIVAEGRDITTVVAPHAQVRVLLVAEPAARVARRQAELGRRVPPADVADQVIRRDRDDSTVARFTEAGDGVVVVDSTHKSLDQVIQEIVDLVRNPASREHIPAVAPR